MTISAAEQKVQALSLRGFDIASYKRTEDYVQAINDLYAKAVNDISKAATSAKIDPNKPFSFKDYPSANAQVNKTITGLTAQIKGVISKGTKEGWLLACKKNDAFLNSILDTSKVEKALLKRYMDNNLDALAAFQVRKVGGLDLSQRIWNYTGQLKGSMELGIDIAVGDGRSASALSRDLRQYLVDPDKLYRRVRDKYGNLKLSKAAAAYHPGQGKYRSSYKNAMRLTRSELNMAYRDSDRLRWEKLDFVIGFEVKLSNNHTLNGKAFVDICNDLVGLYPKTFVWKGWHPQCRCHAIPVLMNEKDFDTHRIGKLRAALKGEEYRKYVPADTVTDVPAGFRKWVEDNKLRSQNWTSMPYFIKDNFAGGNLAGELKLAIPKPVKVKPVKTAAQIADIQGRWNTRLANNKFGNDIAYIESNYSTVDSITAYAGKVKSAIQAGKPVEEVEVMVEKLKHKAATKNAWDIYKEEKQLETLLVDVKGLKAQYPVDELKKVYAAVESKLKTWEHLSIADQIKKLNYEIDWLQKNQKYSTWKVAQEAYKKRLAAVEYLAEKQNVQLLAADALKYAKTTMSKELKAMADEFNKLMGKNANINALKIKAKSLNDKVDALKYKKSLNANSKAKNAPVSTPTGLGKPVNFTSESFTKARKDGAVWAKDAAEADKHLRPVLEPIWQAASKEERLAAYNYTKGSSYINEPLRKMHYSGQYVGIQDGVKDAKLLASLVDQSTYDFDIWVQRGVNHTGAKRMLEFDLSSATEARAKKNLLGRKVTEHAFSSCGGNKYAGFSSSPVIYNIYAPKGSKMLYMEPYSHYGEGDMLKWDGITKHHSFGSEAEILLQRGTTFRVIKVQKSKKKWFIDLEIVEQL